MVAGVVAIIAGASTPSASWSLWLTSIGGAAVGATIGSFFVRLSSEDLVEHVKTTLGKTISSTFTSNDSEIKPIKKKWYHYNVSQKDGEFRWRCAILDFSKDPSIGSLNTLIRFSDKAGKAHEYRVEAALRGERLISFYYPPSGNESIAVEIIPFVGHSFEHFHVGVTFHQTWDSNHALAAIIISENPLLGIKVEGDVPELHDKELSEMWLQGMEKVAPLIKLPGVEDETGERIA